MNSKIIEITPPKNSISDPDLYHQSIAIAMEHISDAVYITSADGIIEYVNPAFERITGYSSEEVIGKNPTILKSGQQNDEYYSDLWTTINGGKTFSSRIVNRDKDGELIHSMKTITPIADKEDNITHFLAVDVDITQQVALESELLHVTEKERREIGLELHDNLGQVMTGISFLSMGLSNKLKKSSPTDEPLAKQISELTSSAVSISRSLSKVLYPVELDSIGIKSALVELAKNIGAIYSISITVDCDIQTDLKDSSSQIHLYRITQEACMNAVKHGDAANIAIGLTVDVKSIKLTIKDDGGGLQNSGLRNGIGLQGMSYRSNLLRGEIQLKKRSSGGIMISMIAPNRTYVTS